MEGKNKTTKAESNKKDTGTNKPVEKKTAPEFYIDGPVNMPSSMITDKEFFYKIWEGNLKTGTIEQAWKKAEKWRKKYD